MNRLRQSSFYIQVNELLKLRLPIIQKEIELTLAKYNNTASLEVNCILERHNWEQATEWRIELSFEDYEYGYDEHTLKPHSIGGFVMLEDVEGKQSLFCNFGQFYNTFKTIDIITNNEKLTYFEIEDKITIDNCLVKLKTFCDLFQSKLLKTLVKLTLKNWARELTEKITTTQQGFISIVFIVFYDFDNVLRSLCQAG